MEAKTFTYQYLEFKPIRQFTKEEEKNSWKGDLLNFKKWFCPEKYNYSDFYEKAKEVGADKFDIFEIQTGTLKGIFAVPCSNYIALITNEEIIGYDNFYRVKVAEKCAELYKELYDSENNLFRACPRVQIYWNNKFGYEFEILVDFDEKALILKVDNIAVDTKKFNDFYYLKKYLEDKDIKYFQEKFSDKKLTNQIAFNVVDNHIDLEKLNDDEQYLYIYFLYKYILYGIYQDEYNVNYKMNDFFNNEFEVMRNKTTNEILEEIRNDVLEQIKKDINIWLFDDMYYDD